tara:strand:+ start:1437 stop:2153 length:717 start_codon:yes stop_codon:yes gene_type:complete
MENEHTVKSFEDELKTLDRLIAEMGGLAEEQLSTAIEAMINRDVDTAMGIKKSDKNIDALAHEIDTTSIRMLALRQPMGQDLRSIVVALKTAAVIERIGDHAKNTAKRTKVLAESPPVGAIKTVKRMSVLVQQMISDVLDAYSKRDAEKAADIRRRDEEVDDLHTSLFRELLTYMMEDPRKITACTHLMFVAKNIERMGDHAANIAKNIHYLVHGERPDEKRSKGDASVYVADPETDA